MEERVRELEERLATMERRLGWWRGGGLAVLALAVAVGAWSCGQVRRPDIIRAKSFELLDERGDIRGRWVWTAETGASFALYSATEPAIMMHSKTSESGAFISISHPNGDDAVWLGSLSQGNASFSLSNSATNIGLRVDNTSIAEFAMYRDDAELVASVGTGESGTAVDLALKAQGTETRLHSSLKNQAVIFGKDTVGKTLFQLP